MSTGLYFHRDEAAYDTMSTSSSILLSAIEGFDDLPAVLVTDGGPEYSRKALRHEVYRTAATFAALGISKGDVVALSFDNDIELIISFFAVCHLGASAAPLNAKYKAEEVIFYLSKFRYIYMYIHSYFFESASP